MTNQKQFLGLHKFFSEETQYQTGTIVGLTTY